MTKKKNEPAFNIEKAYVELELPEMFIAGLKYYIQSNKLQPKNKKEFDKIVKDYGELKI